jgi:hypothetical protein
MDIIQIHLRLESMKTPSGQIIESCLTAALREARNITGREISTGEPILSNQNRQLGSWAGAMCYLTILDQIGKCYRPNTKPFIRNCSAIIKALINFTSLLEAETNAIYALRNAFFHDFSLYNRNSVDPKMQHCFTVDNHPTNSVVVLPVNKWDGLMPSRNAENNTYINLKALGDLVESIYSDLLRLHSVGSLLLDLPGGESELLDRYTFVHF